MVNHTSFVIPVYPVLGVKISDNISSPPKKKRHLLLLLWDQDQEEVEEGGSKTDAPERGFHNDADKDKSIVINQ